MRNEAVVTDRDEFADERVRLNPASPADGCSLLYLHERSDEGVVANVATIQVCGLYDGHIRAELYVNESDRTLPGRIHIAEFRRLTSPFSGRARSRIETTVRA